MREECSWGSCTLKENMRENERGKSKYLSASFGVSKSCLSYLALFMKNILSLHFTLGNNLLFFLKFHIYFITFCILIFLLLIEITVVNILMHCLHWVFGINNTHFKRVLHLTLIYSFSTFQDYSCFGNYKFILT